MAQCDIPCFRYDIFDNNRNRLWAVHKTSPRLCREYLTFFKNFFLTDAKNGFIITKWRNRLRTKTVLARKGYVFYE
jgi:hypothetical protein